MCQCDWSLKALSQSQKFGTWLVFGKEPISQAPYEKLQINGNWPSLSRPAAKFSWSRICEMQLHKVLSRLSATEEAMASSVDDAVWLEKVLCTLNPKSHEKWTFLERPHSLRLFFKVVSQGTWDWGKKEAVFKRQHFLFKFMLSHSSVRLTKYL